MPAFLKMMNNIISALHRATVSIIDSFPLIINYLEEKKSPFLNSAARGLGGVRWGLIMKIGLELEGGGVGT